MSYTNFMYPEMKKKHKITFSCLSTFAKITCLQLPFNNDFNMPAIPRRKHTHINAHAHTHLEHE